MNHDCLDATYCLRLASIYCKGELLEKILNKKWLRSMTTVALFLYYFYNINIPIGAINFYSFTFIFYQIIWSFNLTEFRENISYQCMHACCVQKWWCSVVRDGYAIWRVVNRTVFDKQILWKRKVDNYVLLLH